MEYFLKFKEAVCSYFKGRKISLQLVIINLFQLQGTQDEVETAARAERMIESGRMMRGEPGGHAHVQGPGTGAGHAPDPENAGTG